MPDKVENLMDEFDHYDCLVCGVNLWQLFKGIRSPNRFLLICTNCKKNKEAKIKKIIPRSFDLKNMPLIGLELMKGTACEFASKQGIDPLKLSEQEQHKFYADPNYWRHYLQTLINTGILFPNVGIHFLDDLPRKFFEEIAKEFMKTFEHTKADKNG